MHKTLPYLALFAVVVLLQVFLFDNLSISIYLNPLVYVAFIALLPLDTPPVVLLLSGLATGVTMDLAMGAAGVNTIATLLIAFARPTLLGLLYSVTIFGRRHPQYRTAREPGLPELPDRAGAGAPCRIFLAGSTFVGAYRAHDRAYRGERCRVGGLHLGHRPHLHRQTPRPHMKSSEGFVRMRTLQGVVLFIFLLIAGRLAYIQLVDSKYNELAKANVLRHVVQYPPRGEVFDRNGEYLVQSRECYDLMVIYSEIDKHGFDTVRMCDVLGLSRGKLEKELANARMRPRAPRVVTNYISKEDKLRFDECNFRGFYTVYRTVRRYPRKIGGNLLGYVSEVNADYLKRNPEYKIGDYVGMGGVESAYEPLLRGTKG